MFELIVCKRRTGLQTVNTIPREKILSLSVSKNNY
nr:MAG TPA: hypothetical protein [Bacteriophage sp.]